MPRVHLLDESIANHIAAGEVIERPASVVKELVENALDAGASRIDIRIERAGRQRICVRDNGCGMERDDAVLAVQRHATSKIASLEDLRAIQTLGFRGEALPSIAAVSHLRLVTRRAEDEEGTELRTVGGAIVAVEPVGCPPGAEVTVGRLFYNTPARWKFLKSDQTEVRHIAEVATGGTLSHPECDWSLRLDDREVFVRGATTDRREAAVRVLGREFADALAEVDWRASAGHVTGFLARPDLSRATRAHQFLFVNRRPVRSRTLTYAVEEAYRSLVHGERYPVFVLYLDIPFDEVDVNVHPTKAEVRFVRDREVFTAVRRAVHDALAQARLVPSLPVWQERKLPGGPLPSRPETLSALRAQPLLSSGDAEPRDGALRLRPLAQLRATYLLVESTEGLLVVNQHRAHERVIYDGLVRVDLETEREQQTLTLPPTIQLSPDESAVLDEHRALFRSLGFLLEPFGAHAYLLRAVPAALAKLDGMQLVRDMVEELTSAPTDARSAPPTRALRAREHMLELMACRSAIKAGELLTPEEMRHLLHDLEQCESPALCPHGQPIIFTISHVELDRRFQR